MVRVLVVDSEDLTRHLLTTWLQNWGYEALAVIGVEQALACMRTMPADIVIADTMMPESDNMWLLNQLNEHWPRTIVIMEKGTDDLETALRTRLRGAFDHVPTPLSPEMLHQAVERARRAILPPEGQAPPPARFGIKQPTES